MKPLPTQAFLTANGLWRGRRIGLYGGSFNPAHDGHLHVALQALRRLRLDAIWWLVSPQNPLKAAAGMAPLADRLAAARRLARHPRFFVTDVEQYLATRYTADMLRALKRRHPESRFVWLMGADGLAELHHWDQWKSLMRMVPIAVIDRPGYSRKALKAPAARLFARYRKPERQAARLAMAQAPAWTFLHGPLNPSSATAIRTRL